MTKDYLNQKSAALSRKRKLNQLCLVLVVLSSLLSAILIWSAFTTITKLSGKSITISSDEQIGKLAVAYQLPENRQKLEESIRHSVQMEMIIYSLADSVKRGIVFFCGYSLVITFVSCLVLGLAKKQSLDMRVPRDGGEPES